MRKGLKRNHGHHGTQMLFQTSRLDEIIKKVKSKRIPGRKPQGTSMFRAHEREEESRVTEK